MASYRKQFHVGRLVCLNLHPCHQSLDSTRVSHHWAWLSSSEAAFFALTGVLIATSVANIGKSGISFFYLTFLIPLLSLAFPYYVFIQHRLNVTSMKMLFWIYFTALAISITTMLQIVLGMREAGEEIVHLSSRLSFILYLVVAQRCLRGKVVLKTLVWLRRLLIIICAYGIYQLPAKVFGLPLFLDWLRNNQSFNFYDYDAAGWIGMIRATSIFAEPSQATIPIVVLFMLNLQINSCLISKVTGWVVLVLFTTVTFSRTAWVTLLVTSGVFVACQSSTLCRKFRVWRLALTAVVLALLLLLPAWAFIRSNNDSDLSKQERSASIILGYHMIMDSPLIGFGWNSFGDLGSRYDSVALPADSSIDFKFIDNMVLSYIQQVGLSGFLLAALPFILIVFWSTSEPWITYSTLASFLVAAELGGDVGYSPLMWLWIVLLTNRDHLQILSNGANTRRRFSSFARKYLL